MTHYRLYFFDLAGNIRHALNLECEDDDHALRMVSEHADGRPMELWQGQRQVAFMLGEKRKPDQPPEE